MRVIIVANGPLETDDRYRALVAGAHLMICADGGANTALAHGWEPDIVVGDMDSITSATLSYLEAAGAIVLRYSPRKDETDLELALTEAVTRGATDILVLGAIGGRTDHTIANVMLLALPTLIGKRVRILDYQTELALIRDVAYIYGSPGDTVSLIPIIGDARGVTTEGLEWELDDGTLAFGYARGVSNVLTATQARIEVREGLLLMTHAPISYPWGQDAPD